MGSLDNRNPAFNFSQNTSSRPSFYKKFMAKRDRSTSPVNVDAPMPEVKESNNEQVDSSPMKVESDSEELALEIKTPVIQIAEKRRERKAELPVFPPIKDK